MIVTAGKYKGRKILAPDEKIVRPTLSKIRESVFNVLFSLLDSEGKSFLDMYAGSGIMGLEALSRGFNSSLELEKNPKVAQIIKSNFLSLGLKPNIMVGDSLKKVKILTEKFDVIFVDPPYYSGIYEESLKSIYEKTLLKKDGIVVLEHVTAVEFENLGFELIKQKRYADKIVTFLKIK